MNKVFTTLRDSDRMLRAPKNQFGSSCVLFTTYVAGQIWSKQEAEYKKQN